MPSLLIMFLLLGLNGFFAGAEVALLSVRNSRLRQMADEGVIGAAAALQLLANPGRLLSATQVGVTLTSLGLGWTGEEGAFRLLVTLLRPIETPATVAFLHGLAFVLSFLLISYLHVVLGEVVPKNIAIDKADRLAVLVAPPLLFFGRISSPFVFVLERSSDILSRALGVRGGNIAGGHSAEELRLIVSSSRGLGFLRQEQEDMIHRALELDSIIVREVMAPRQDMKAIPLDSSLEQVLAAMIEHGHSRLPVYRGTTEHVVGILHYKDLLPLWAERLRAVRSGRPPRPFRLERLLRKAYVVPETKPLMQMLEEFREGRSHIAMVVDEFGTIVGMLTVEDVLEQIVGRIEDEHDEKTERPLHEPADIELDGATRLRDLETEYGLDIPSEGGFETLAGFVMYQLDAIPRPGDTFEHEGRRFTVVEMDRHRVARIRIERLPAQPVAATG